MQPYNMNSNLYIVFVIFISFKGFYVCILKILDVLQNILLLDLAPAEGWWPLATYSVVSIPI
jgi:hypothetical protein